MSKAPQVTTSPLDEDLIQAAVECACLMAAHRAGYSVDPCGNMSHQWKLRHSEKACRKLAFLADTKARSADGLIAKARILPQLFDPDSPDEFTLDEESSLRFILGFAADCANLIRPSERAATPETTVAFAKQLVELFDKPRFDNRTFVPVYDQDSGAMYYARKDGSAHDFSELTILTEEFVAPYRQLAGVQS